MFLNIITPCSRPENLHIISKSINIPKENYRWIIVYDGLIIPDSNLIPENCEIYTHVNDESQVGHSQRNFALNLINNGHVYFNDDDTIIHPNLWDNIQDLDDDFISFGQEDKNGKLRLKGNVIKLYNIDSHNFIVKRSTIGDTSFIVNDYNADGYFAEECYSKANTKIFIDKILSTYNLLR